MSKKILDSFIAAILRAWRKKKKRWKIKSFSWQLLPLLCSRGWHYC